MSTPESLVALDQLRQGLAMMFAHPSPSAVEQVRHTVDTWDAVSQELKALCLKDLTTMEETLTYPRISVTIDYQGRPPKTLHFTMKDEWTVNRVLDMIAQNERIPLDQIALRRRGSTQILDGQQILGDKREHDVPPSDKQAPGSEVRQGVRSQDATSESDVLPDPDGATLPVPSPKWYYREKEYELVPRGDARWHLPLITTTVRYNGTELQVKIAHNVPFAYFLNWFRTKRAPHLGIKPNASISDGNVLMDLNANMFDYLTAHPRATLHIRDIDG